MQHYRCQKHPWFAHWMCTIGNEMRAVYSEETTKAARAASSRQRCCFHQMASAHNILINCSSQTKLDAVKRSKDVMKMCFGRLRWVMTRQHVSGSVRRRSWWGGEHAGKSTTGGVWKLHTIQNEPERAKEGKMPKNHGRLAQNCQVQFSSPRWRRLLDFEDCS